MRLREEGPVLRITQHNVFAYVAAAIFLAIGAGFIFTSDFSLFDVLFIIIPLIFLFVIKRDDVRVDFSTQTVIAEKKSLIKKEKREISFKDIVAIEMREVVKRGSKGGVTYAYPLYAVLRDGSDAHLAEEAGKSRMIIDTSKDERRIGQTLAQRLGVEFREQKAPSAGEMFSMAKQAIGQKMEETMKK